MTPRHVSGATQDEARQLFERFRDAVGCNRKDASEEEDRVEDVICDVMDSIVGWCHTNAYIYSETFHEAEFWKWYETIKW